MKWNKTLILAAALIAGSAVNAASFSSSDLPAGSNWYVHINVDLLRTSTLGRRIMEKTIDEAFEEIESELGFQFSQDIEAITVFGGQLPPDRGAIVVHGAIPLDTQNRLLDFLELNGSGLTMHDFAGMNYYEVAKEIGHKEIRVESVGDPVEEAEFHDVDRETVFFAFGSDQSMFSQSVESIEMFLEANGHLSGLKSADPNAMVVLQADRAMLQGGLNTAMDMGHSNWDSSILSNVDSIAVVLADEMGAASVHAEVQAKSPEIAESVLNIVQGLIALRALDVAGEPVLCELLRAVNIETDGAMILFDVYLEESLIEQLRDL